MELTIGLAWFKSTLAGNEIWRFLAWLGGVLVAFLVGRIVRHHLHQLSLVMDRRQKHLASVFLRAAARAMVFALVAIALDAGCHFLILSDRAELVMKTVMNVLIVVATTYVVYCIADAICRAWALSAAKTASTMDDMLVPMVRRSLQITVVVLGLIQVATVLSDKPLTSILAGLGVGGLAVALAAQETIKNFFGSITILTDKPFELGDRVVIDKYDGTVVEVGFRSTRIRTLDGDLVTIPNGELANKSILNSGRKPFFRRVITLGPRVYFTEFSGSSLTLTASYWHNSTDGWNYLECSEVVNLQILDRFHEEGIGLVVQPSQTVYLSGKFDVK